MVWFNVNPRVPMYGTDHTLLSTAIAHITHVGIRENSHSAAAGEFGTESRDRALKKSATERIVSVPTCLWKGLMAGDVEKSGRNKNGAYQPRKIMAGAGLSRFAEKKGGGQKLRGGDSIQLIASCAFDCIQLIVKMKSFISPQISMTPH